MRHRVTPLVVALLILAGIQPDPAPADIRGASGNGYGFGAGLLRLPMPPDTPEDLKVAADWAENVARAWTLLHNMEPCASAGFSSDECADGVWAGSCTMYLELGVSAAPEFILLGLPFEALCKGEPPYKCCKYEPETQVGCHTAFNQEFPPPINCEGNWTQPNAKSYGPCLWDGDPLHLGCTCCGIAECFTPACDPAKLSDPISGAWRTDTLAKKIAGSFKSAARNDPDGATKFVTLADCTAHRDVMLTLAPYAHPDTLPSPDPGGNFHASDNNPDARYMRGMITLAVRRVLAGIPNGIARWQSISARVWTDAEIEAAVATVGDADAILLRLLGPFGFEVLRGADARHYKLLAVPLPDEPPNANDSVYVAGCVVGQGAIVGILTDILANCVTVQLEVQDPLAASMPNGHYLAAVDWGDGRLQQIFLTSPTQQITHCYDAEGTYTVRAWTVNAAGVATSTETTAVVGAPEGPVDPGPKSVSSIALDLTAVTFAHMPPRVTVTASAIDPAGTAYLLNRLYAPAPARPAGYATDRFAIPGTLSHYRATPVSSLKLSVGWTGGNVVWSAQALLGEVTLTNWDNSQRTVRPTPNDVQWLPAGATYPVAPLIDPATGALILPAASEQIAVALPSSGTPFAGCLPIYAPVTVTMETADGGCKDLGTGRTWSLTSPPATFAQAQAYCAGLTQGGLTGWRLPTDAELISVTGATKAATFFAFPTSGVYAWTTDNWFGASHITRNLATGGFGVTADTSLAAAVCVR